MANRRFIDFPVATTVGANDIILIWQDGLNKQTTKATILSGLPEDLEDLADVNISGLTNGQILRYDSTTGAWVNDDQANLDLADLNDVSIVSPSNGQVLVYNSTTSKWENSSAGFVPYVGAVTTVDLGAQGLRAGYVKFDTSVVSVPDEQGLMYWDGSRSTAALIMNGTIQHIGQDTFFYVKNATGSSIPKGTAVRFAGTDGASGHLLITPFLANGSVPSTYFMGVTAETIGNGAFGQVMHFGELEGINTSGFTAGDLLYASTTVAGGFQTTAPVAPNNIVLIAATINSKNNGAILVRPTYGSNINTDEGVKITSPATGQLLQLQAGGLWENKTLGQVIGGTSSQFLKGDGSLDSTTYQSTADKGQPNGYASLDSNGKVPLVQINDALIGNVNFQGLWNASTNSPTLANPPSAGTKGYYYIVDTSGTFAGITFEVGDWIISNGSAWGKVDNTDAVSSVFGRTGNVTAANGDYTTAQVTESGNLYYTDARSRAALSFVAGSGAYNSTTGVITIPTNNNQITNGAGYITSAALSSYLPLAGGTMTGNITFNAVSGRGLFWGMNTDGALIRFISTGDSAGQSYLEIGTTDNSDEPIIFTQTGLTRVQIATDGLLKNGSSQNYLFENGGTWGVNITGNAATVTNGVYTSRTITINGTTQDLSANRTYNVGTVTSVGLSTSTSGISIGSTPITSSGTITIDIDIATDAKTGLLSSTDWNTFNNKQNALTNPVTGTGTTNYLPKFTGNTTIGNSIVFDNGTNVGIGTNNPAWMLELNKNTSSGSFGQYPAISVNNPNALGFSAYYFFSGGANKGGFEFSNGDNSLRFFNGSESIRIFSSTNVHIGPTPGSDNGARLQVSGTATVSDLLTINANSGANALKINGRSSDNTGTIDFFQNNGSTRVMEIGVSPTAAEFYYDANSPMIFFTNATERMRITSSGNVGIGITSVSGKLDVFSTNDVYTNIYTNGNNTSSVLSLFNSSGVTDGAAICYNVAMRFGTVTGLNAAGFTERLRITSSGNVEATGSIKTGNPSGSSAQPFKVGSIAGSGNSFFGTVLKMEINGTVYDIMIATPPS